MNFNSQKNVAVDKAAARSGTVSRELVLIALVMGVAVVIALANIVRALELF